MLRLSALFFFAFAIGVEVLAQSIPQIDFISEKLQNFTISFPQEKVYLHTDRKYYAPSETIWFQAYLTAGYYHEPSPFSTNIHLGLFNTKKQLVYKSLIYAKDGYGNGQIDLPDSIPPGNYLLQAYTTWMLNFNSHFLFEKTIVIIGSNDQPSVPEKDQDIIDIQFFPEGGYLLDGIASKVAFKAIDVSGRGTPILGRLYDGDGKELSKVASEHDGMGAFAITPEARGEYVLKLDSSEHEFPLPSVKKQGVAMSVSQPKGALKLTFSTNSTTKISGKHTVIIHTRGVISYAFQIDLSKKVAIGTVPTDIIPDGISHITLFDENNRPVLERLVFIDEPSASITIATDQESYSPREKSILKLKAQNVKGGPLKGVFSLSVVDLGQTLELRPENTIYSELLLNSDIIGHLSNPMYYFDRNNPVAKNHLDLVMMTHGWRRFKWDDFLNNIYPNSDHGVEQGLKVSGTMYRSLSNKPEASGKVTFVNQQTKTPTIVETETSKEGRFVFENLVVFENDEVLLRGENFRGKKTVWFELDSANSPSYINNFHSTLAEEPIPKAKKETFVESSAKRELIEDAYTFDSTVYILESVVVEASRTEATKERLERTAYGSGTDSFNFLDWPSSNAVNDVFTTLVGKFPGVSILPGGIGSDPKIAIRQSGLQTPPPLILLDDVAVDISIVSSMPVDNFSRVVLFKGTSASAIFGSAGMGGALAFYTKGADGIVLPKSKQESSVLVTQLKNSFQQPKEFYAPKYNVVKPEHVKPDQRVVLHWQPMIMLDENGEATVTFWNSDQETDILIDIQGLSTEGDPLQINKIYRIGKN